MLRINKFGKNFHKSLLIKCESNNKPINDNSSKIFKIISSPLSTSSSCCSIRIQEKKRFMKITSRRLTNNQNIFNFSTFEFPNDNYKDNVKKNKRIGKFKNSIIRKKNMPEVKTVFYDFGDKQITKLNENNELNFKNSHNKENENNDNRQTIKDFEDFNKIFSQLNDYNLDNFNEQDNFYSSEGLEIGNKNSDKAFLDKNQKDKFDDKNFRSKSHGNKDLTDIINSNEKIKVGKGETKFAHKSAGKNNRLNKKMDYLIEYEDPEEFIRYTDKFNFILNFNHDSVPVFSPNNRFLGNPRYNISSNPDFESHLNKSKSNEQDNFNSTFNLDYHKEEDFNSDEDKKLVSSLNNDAYIEKNLNRENHLSPLNNTIKNPTTLKKYTIEEYNEIIICSFYELIDLIPKKSRNSQYYIDVVKLIDMKRVSDENLIFYFFEKSIFQLIEANMYGFCHVACKLMRFLCVLRFYVENLKDISFIENDYFQFLDDHFINLSKKDIYLKRQLNNTNNGLSKEYNNNSNKSSDQLNQQAESYIEDDKYKHEEEYFIKNKRLESYIKNQLDLDKNEIFAINYEHDQAKIADFLKRNINGVKNTSANNMNSYKNRNDSSNGKIKNTSFSDFIKEQEKIDNSKSHSHKNSAENINKENLYYNNKYDEVDISFLNTANTVEELEMKCIENKLHSKLNPIVDDLEEKKTITNDNSSIEIDREKILLFLTEEKIKLFKILEHIISIDYPDCKQEKRIIMIKLLKISFLIKFHKNFDYFEDPKFISEIMRTYRYLFIGNIDSKITDILIKKIILLLYKANFYNSFLLSKNAFMILRDLSTNPKNYEIIREKSEYFKVMLNFLFEKINKKNLNLLSFKEVGLLIFMMGETQLGNEQNYQVINNYVINELGNSFISRKISNQNVKAFYKYVNFVLVSFCTNLNMYDHSASDELIVNFLKNSENLPHKYLITFSMSFYKLQHENPFIWLLLYKHFVVFATQNNGNFPYSVKFIFDYIHYIYKRKPELNEINQTFLNFYLEKLLEIYLGESNNNEKSFLHSLQNNQQQTHFFKKNYDDNHEKKHLIGQKNIEDEPEDSEDISSKNLKKELKKHFRDQDKEIETKTDSPILSDSFDKNNINKVVLSQKDLNEYDRKHSQEQDNEEDQEKIEYEKLYNSLLNGEKKLNENLVNSPDSFFRDRNDIVNFVLKKCEKYNKISLGSINNKIISGFILYKINKSFVDDGKKLSYFEALDLKYIDESTLKNIKQILYIIDFSLIPNFSDFVNEKIFDSEDNILLKKLVNYIEKDLQAFKDFKFQLSDDGFDEYRKRFISYNNIIKNFTNDEYLLKLHQHLNYELNSNYILEDRNNMI